MKGKYGENNSNLCHPVIFFFNIFWWFDKKSDNIAKNLTNYQHLPQSRYNNWLVRWWPLLVGHSCRFVRYSNAGEKLMIMSDLNQVLLDLCCVTGFYGGFIFLRFSDDK